MRTITIKVQVPGAHKGKKTRHHGGKKGKGHGRKHKQTRKQRAASLRNLKKARKALRSSW